MSPSASSSPGSLSIQSCTGFDPNIDADNSIYIGISWARKFGGTADYAREDGEPTDDLQFVAGVRIWF